MSAEQLVERLKIVDSHTEGEPTRVVIEGFPELSGATMAERREDFAKRFDYLRQGTVREPRGHDAVVGALLTSPVNEGSDAGVIFYNDVGYLGMCGHGLIGVAQTLKHLGRAAGERLQIDTPVGTVEAWIEGDTVTIQNVAAYSYKLDVEVDVPDVDVIKGDIAYGGNWFFLTAVPEKQLQFDNLEYLMHLTRQIRRTLRQRKITGEGGAEIDHIELYSPSPNPDADARNFVLCPGVAYDRSPCGTGTSAKMATLYARGELKPMQRWVQESITGSTFTGWLKTDGAKLIPHIQGRAFITADSTIHFNANDPFRWGITA